MSMIVKENGGAEIPMLEAGVYTAYSNALVDLGVQRSEKFQKDIRTFRIIWVICEEEVENYICRTRGNLLLRWYLHRKMKKNKEKLLLESRVTSVIRALAVAYIEENDEIDEEIVTKNVKNIILTKTKEYMSK